MSNVSQSLKSIDHYNHVSTLQIENRLCHLCSCRCGVNKPEPTSHFSFYLLTHPWVFLPVIFLHSSWLKDRIQSEWTGIPIQSTTYHILCYPSERVAGIVTTWFTFMMMHILPNWHRNSLLTTQLKNQHIHSDHLFCLRSYKKLLWILPNWKTNV